jgi:hypothetical protein
MTVEHIRLLESQGFYSFKAKVFDVRPVARFILGLSQEINIVQGKELIDFLDYQLKHVFTKKTLETRPTKPAVRIAKKLTVPRNK